MIPRAIRSSGESALARQAAVAITGPCQVGQTTLLHQIAEPYVRASGLVHALLGILTSLR